MPEMDDRLIRLQQLIESAEVSLHSAKLLIAEINGDTNLLKKHKADIGKMASQLGKIVPGEQKVIEGVFDGQNMIGPDEKAYPVAANYASKSKLIPGDVLKLTVNENGAFIYKQINPADRKRVTGNLVYEDGQYKVVAEGKTYNVLLASVTYFKANVGDEITLLVPTNQESQWGAIENVVPKL